MMCLVWQFSLVHLTSILSELTMGSLQVHVWVLKVFRRSVAKGKAVLP